MNIKHSEALFALSALALAGASAVSLQSALASGLDSLASDSRAAAIGITEPLRSCPFGYVCTPIPYVPGCPTGYLCTVATSSTPLISVTDQPNLSLSYSTARQESSLGVRMSVAINPGSAPMWLYSNVGATVIFKDESGHQMSGSATLSPVMGSVQASTDQFGRTVYVLAPGKNYQFAVTSSVNPQVMFSGSYRANVAGLFMNPVNAADLTPTSLVTVPTNSSNAVTIVGERMPYITSVVYNVGQSTITITGQRLGGAGAVFDDYSKPFATIPQQNMTSAVVKLPPSIVPDPAGATQHGVTLVNDYGKAYARFTVPAGVAATTSAVILIDAANPLATTVNASSVSATTSSYVGLPVLVFDIKSTSTLTLRSLSVPVTVTGSAGIITAHLSMGSNEISSTQLAYSPNPVANFTFTSVPVIVANATVPFTIKLDVTGISPSGVVVSANINPVGVTLRDSNGADVALAPQGLQGNLMTILASSQYATVANAATALSSIVANNGATTTQQFNFTYSVTAGNYPIYISKALGQAIWSTVSTNGMSISPIAVFDNDSSNDGAGYIYIAPGQTKSINAQYVAVGRPGMSAVCAVTSLNYGTSTASMTAFNVTTPSVLNSLSAVLSF